MAIVISELKNHQKDLIALAQGPRQQISGRTLMFHSLMRGTARTERLCREENACVEMFVY